MKLLSALFLFTVLISFNANSKCDTNIINSKNDIAFDMAYSKPKEALKLVDEIISTSQRCSFPIGEIRAYIRKGICYDVLNEPPKAIFAYEQGLEIAKKINYQKGIASIENNLGLIYWKLGELKKAQEMFQRALNSFTQRKDWENAGNASNNLGLIMEEFGDADKAIKWYKKSLHLYKKGNTLRPTFSVYSNLSNAYVTLKQYKTALFYCEKALDGFRELKSEYDLGIALNNYGLVFTYIDQNEEAIKHFSEARVVTKKLENTYSYISASLNYSVALGNLGRTKEKKEILESIYPMAFEEKSDELIYKIAFELSTLAYKERRIVEAEKYLSVYKEHQTEYFNDLNAHEIAKMEVLYSVKEQEKNNKEYRRKMISTLEQQKTARALDNTIWISVLFGIFLISLLTFFINRKRNLQKELIVQHNIYEATSQERKRISYELHDLVGSQLSFVVSNLELLTYKAPEDDRINRTFHMSQEAMGSLRDTVWALNNEKINSKILVERMRNLKHKWLDESDIYAEITEDLIGIQTFDPSVTLHIMRIFQEAITNIYKHANATKVDISVLETESTLIISIKDNGIGFDDSKEMLFHYGMKSMKERAVKINAELKIESKINEGTLVKLEWKKIRQMRN